MMLEDLQQTVLGFFFLNLREVMVGTLFYCKTLEKRTEKKKQCTVHLPYNLYLRTFY